MDIVEVLKSSNFFADTPRATNIRYTRVDKMMLRRQGVLCLLETLSKDAPAAKTFVVSRTLMTLAYLSVLRGTSSS